jgi:hypothetical protein
MPATPWSWSSTTRRSCRPRIGCSTSARARASTAARSYSTGAPANWRRPKTRSPPTTCFAAGASRPRAGRPPRLPARRPLNPGRTAHCASRAPPAQSQEHRCRVPAAPPGVRDRRQRLGQIHAGPRCPVPALLRAKGKPTEESRRAPRARGRRTHRRGHHGGSEPHRPHHALESRELRRRLRRDPQSVRATAGSARAQVHGRHLQLQCRQRTLSRLRRQRLRARRDAIPLGRVPALSGLRWPALPRRGARGQAAARRLCAHEHCRCARSDRLAGARPCSPRRRGVPRWRRWRRSVSTICAWASPCPRCPAARRSASSWRRIWPNAVRERAGAGRRGSLFLFDEPTTGLHFDDVAKLLRAFRRLIEAGHSLLVIEHNLDVVAPRTGSSISAPRAAKPAARGVRRHPGSGDARSEVAHRPRCSRPPSRRPRSAPRCTTRQGCRTPPRVPRPSRSTARASTISRTST